MEPQDFELLFGVETSALSSGHATFPRLRKSSLSHPAFWDIPSDTEQVHERLRETTNLVCLSNGLKGSGGSMNPLGVQIPGARAVRSSYVCNPKITVELDVNGNVDVIQGTICAVCT
jgi:hypothetical protein